MHRGVAHLIGEVHNHPHLLDQPPQEGVRLLHALHRMPQRCPAVVVALIRIGLHFEERRGRLTIKLGAADHEGGLARAGLLVNRYRDELIALLIHLAPQDTRVMHSKEDPKGLRVGFRID